MIESSDFEKFVSRGESFTAEEDVVVMSVAKYRRIQRLVADEWLRARTGGEGKD